ncbi:hypothetical protein JOC94_001139 [Bacillus thermophilus]|uniref:Uncharacterized protein n=1 Tax=Siminovitchia thermophila TaxID=1245522 RepID=A0ABS2R3G6_9BACI|nr:hypothetical protein [Siminovitchia thermophila]
MYVDKEYGERYSTSVHSGYINPYDVPNVDAELRTEADAVPHAEHNIVQKGARGDKKRFT